MTLKSFRLVLLVCGAAALAGPSPAQDVRVPYVAPRPANTLVMLPDGSTVHVELATTEAEREYGLMGRTKLPEGRGMLFRRPRHALSPRGGGRACRTPTGCTTSKSGSTSSGWTP